MPTVCRITDIAWTRVRVQFLAAVSGLPAGSAVTFAINDRDRTYEVGSAQVSETTYRLDINVTNFRYRAEVPDGSWRIVAYVDGRPVCAAEPDASVSARLAGAGRGFLYAENSMAYTVTFSVSAEVDAATLLMHTYLMTWHGPKASRWSRPRRLRRRFVTTAAKSIVINGWYRTMRSVCPSDGKTILFASDARSAIGSNLLRIRDRMIERGLDTRYVLRYSFRSAHGNSKWSTLRVVRDLARADLVLIDDYFALLEVLRVDAQTKIIQTWHAGGGFKSVGLSRFGKLASPPLHNAHRKYTYAVAGSTLLVPMFAEAFGIEDSAVIPTGLPRIDTFLDPAQSGMAADRFFADRPSLRGKRIILFAPTFRGKGTSTAHYDYARIDFDKLHEVCGQDAVVLFRMHHYVSKPVPIPARLADRLHDLSSYAGSTNDLLHVADLLITDYSSLIHEFSLLDKPILFYAYDLEVYTAARGVHSDIDRTAPGKVCHSMDEIVDAIRNADFEDWKVERFRQENFDVIDRHSADRVIDQLILGEPLQRSPDPQAT